MKKTAIFSLVACAIGAFFLIAILVIGINSDGLRTEADPVKGDDYEWEYTYAYSWDPEETSVSGLNINWGAGDVTIKTTSGGLIHIKEYSDKELDEETQLELSSSGGTLVINESSDLLSSMFNININLNPFKREEKELVIAVPESIAAEMEELRCDNISGNIDIAEFTAKELEVSSVSGDVKLSAIECETAVLSTTSGDIFAEDITSTVELGADTTSGGITLDGKAEALNLDTISGDISYTGEAKQVEGCTVSATIKLELDKCPEISALDAVSGDLILAIPENSGFEVEYDSVSGELYSDFPMTGNVGKSGRALYGSGEGSLSFNTTSGSMEIIYNK